MKIQFNRAKKTYCYVDIVSKSKRGLCHIPLGYMWQRHYNLGKKGWSLAIGFLFGKVILGHNAPLWDRDAIADNFYFAIIPRLNCDVGDVPYYFPYSKEWNVLTRYELRNNVSL